MGSYIIREYKPEDKEKIFRLVNNTIGSYTAYITQKIWDWLFLNNPFNPDGSAHILVSEFNSDIIGLICNIFVDLKINNKITKARWGCNFITHPKHRGKGIRLFRRCMEIPYYPFLGFPNKRALMLTTKMGTHYFGSIYSRIRILNMNKFLQNKIKNRFIACLGGLIWNLISMIYFKRQISNKDISIKELTYFDDKFNKFWEEASSDYPVIVVRNQKYLNWRFIKFPLKYHIFAANKNNDILGYLVLRIIQKDGLKRGYIVDILGKVNNRKTLNALVSKAVLYFKENKCDLIECLILTNKKIYHDTLKKHGFLVKRFRCYLDGYNKDEKELSLIKNPDNWFITASDPDLEIWF